MTKQLTLRVNHNICLLACPLDSQERPKSGRSKIAAMCQEPTSVDPVASDAAFISPGEHVKLRQYRRIKPTVFDGSFGKPTKPSHQLVNIRLIGSSVAARMGLHRIADLKIDRQRRKTRRYGSRVIIVALIEYNDLKHAARPKPGDCPWKNASCKTYTAQSAWPISPLPPERFSPPRSAKRGVRGMAEKVAASAVPQSRAPPFSIAGKAVPILF